MAKGRSHRGFERLEDRLALSTLGPSYPIWVQPPGDGLPAMEMPPLTTAPPGTTQLPAPPTSTLPPLVGDAEAVGSTTGMVFQLAHPDFATTVTDDIGAGSFTVTVKMTGGTDFYSYTVTETASQITVNFYQHMSAADIITVVTERPATGDGALMTAQFVGGQLNAETVQTEYGGVVTTDYQYLPPATPPVGPPQGSHNQALLDEVYGQFSADVGFLSVPEPSTVAMLIGLAVSAAGYRAFSRSREKRE